MDLFLAFSNGRQVSPSTILAERVRTKKPIQPSKDMHASLPRFIEFRNPEGVKLCAQWLPSAGEKEGKELETSDVLLGISS